MSTIILLLHPQSELRQLLLTNQRLYGLAEIGFALAVAWSSMMRAQSTSEAASWLATLAAAYLVVRGLSNYEEGFEKHFRKKYIKK